MQDMTSQRFPHTFPMMGNTCTDKLCTAAIVHFPKQNTVISTCLSLQRLVATTRAQVSVSTD